MAMWHLFSNGPAVLVYFRHTSCYSGASSRFLYHTQCTWRCWSPPPSTSLYLCCLTPNGLCSMMLALSYWYFPDASYYTLTIVCTICGHLSICLVHKCDEILKCPNLVYPLSTWFHATVWAWHSLTAGCSFPHVLCGQDPLLSFNTFTPEYSGVNQ